jgi:hypothetical protein
MNQGAEEQENERDFHRVGDFLAGEGDFLAGEGEAHKGRISKNKREYAGTKKGSLFRLPFNLIGGQARGG